MIYDFNGPYTIGNIHPLLRDAQTLCYSVEGPRGVGFLTRAELAATHLLHIPERLFNIVTNIVKLALTTKALAWTAKPRLLIPKASHFFATLREYQKS
ncbi:hypothetical protein [Estrella lausannensis]|uniref:Uncharacterized protein n=1 Tax=Estrella lausannensis TaxID=483423 RepID=A0A0H5DPZ4_9BACT|nr:hypothetical protein [Estrella lausannensis]CRX38098.1 hypothetical protein ELAC_0746 [Estrella lausannensis]